MTKTKFNYEQYLRILVALRRAFIPLCREIVATAQKKKQIDRCVKWMKEGIPESEGQEMEYMVAHLCFMQETYAGELEKYFRPSTLWRPSRFPGYVDDITVANYNRAKSIIDIDNVRQTTGVSDKFLVPLPIEEACLLHTFKQGTRIDVPSTPENLHLCRKYIQLEGAPQGPDLILALQHICRTTDTQYLTFKSLIGDPTRVFKAHSSLQVTPVAPAKHKVADPGEFWTIYRRMEALGAVTETVVRRELKGNQVARFLLDAKALEAVIHEEK